MSESKKSTHLSVRSLLVLTCFVALLSSSFTQDKREDRLRQPLIDDIGIDGVKSYSPGNYNWPLHTRWLHRLFGNTHPASLGHVTFSPQAAIYRRTVSKLCVFTEIETIQFDGELYLDDASIDQLATLPNLKQLNLGDAEVSEDSVKRLRTALPACNVEWQPNVR